MVCDKDVVSTLPPPQMIYTGPLLLSLEFFWNYDFPSDELMLKKISKQPMNMNYREEYKVQCECPFPPLILHPPISMHLFSFSVYPNTYMFKLLIHLLFLKRDTGLYFVLFYCFLFQPFTRT